MDPTLAFDLLSEVMDEARPYLAIILTLMMLPYILKGVMWLYLKGLLPKLVIPRVRFVREDDEDYSRYADDIDDVED